MTLRYNTIIFDMDGTLLNTLEDLTNAVNHALAKHGYMTHTKEAVRSFIGNGVGILIKKALPENIDENAYETVLESFKEYYSIHCNDKTCVYDGIYELFDKLKAQGAYIAVVSNKLDSAVKELGETYFKGRVDLLIGERKGVRRKPAPDVINEVLKVAESTPKSAVYIGDSEVDIMTAKNSGIKGISITWGYRNEDFLKANGAKTIAASPSQVYNILTENFSKAFFRLYDRKLCSGEITFSETGMKKNDFTRLCIDDTYVLPYHEILKLSERMKLTEAEKENLLSYAEKDDYIPCN